VKFIRGRSVLNTSMDMIRCLRLEKPLFAVESAWDGAILGSLSALASAAVSEMPTSGFLKEALV
jgi:hypothetical protein